MLVHIKGVLILFFYLNINLLMIYNFNIFLYLSQLMDSLSCDPFLPENLNP